jgi:bifunctional NMN adenylyltransferase/nudix hydrolase
MKEYKYAIVIGRFQPVHKAHIELIKESISKAEECIIVVGSAFGPRTTKNPFTYEERSGFLSGLFSMWGPMTYEPKTHIVPARDYFYNNNLWIESIQQQIYSITGDEERICLVGAYKDNSSSYVNMFPQWDYIPFQMTTDINATAIREKLFKFQFEALSDLLHPSTNKEILLMTAENWFDDLQKEHEYICAYKQQWNDAPYPPTFLCSDAVVIKSGHVLVCRRGNNPGKGLFALPGGFVRQDETLTSAAIRELKEETKIRLTKGQLKDKIIEEKIFDYPGRSLRGRTVSHAVYINLGKGNLPEISRKGGDDADGAFWMQITDVQKSEEKFFEDHFHIINYFVKIIK